MALSASRTSAAARRCWGSRTSSFRIRHTVFSETLPSLVRKKRKKPQHGDGCWPWTQGSRIQWCCCFLTEIPEGQLILPHPLVRKQDSLGDGVLGSLDLAEELLWDAVVEGELSIEHGEENHTQGPHVTRLAPVWPAWGQSTCTRSWADVPGQLLTPNPTCASGCPLDVLTPRASTVQSSELLNACSHAPQDDTWVLQPTHLALLRGALHHLLHQPRRLWELATPPIPRKAAPRADTAGSPSSPILCPHLAWFLHSICHCLPPLPSPPSLLLPSSPTRW